MVKSFRPSQGYRASPLALENQDRKIHPRANIPSMQGTTPQPAKNQDKTRDIIPAHWQADFTRLRKNNTRGYEQ